jgi:hypothetical protein
MPPLENLKNRAGDSSKRSEEEKASEYILDEYVI